VMRSILAVKGADAAKFLQSLCTSDVSAVSAAGQATAFLTNKGRVFADGVLWKDSEGSILVDVAASQEAALARHLKLYKLRSAVTIAAEEDARVVTRPEPHDGFFEDPRAASKSLGYRGILKKSLEDEEDPVEYRRRRLAAGVAESDEIAGRVPLVCNLDLLGHVSFSKGCYLGQELTARAFHRGTVRKRILPVVLAHRDSHFVKGTPVLDVADVFRYLRDDLEGDVAVGVKPGTSLHADGKEVGSLIASEGPIGLAVLPLDFCGIGSSTAAASHGDLVLGGEAGQATNDFALRVYRPAWWPDDLAA